MRISDWSSDVCSSDLRFIEDVLAKQPWLMGDHFTVADAYLFTLTNWAKHVALDLSGFPALLAFQKRVAQRPAVPAALERSEERRVGEACVSKGHCRWAPYDLKKA